MIIDKSMCHITTVVLFGRSEQRPGVSIPEATPAQKQRPKQVEWLGEEVFGRDHRWRGQFPSSFNMSPLLCRVRISPSKRLGEHERPVSVQII